MEKNKNEDSPQREYELCLEEYRALRNEISHRIRMQFQIIAASLVLIAAAFPFIPSILEKERFFTFLLIAPIYLALGWLYFEQDTFITQAATYLNSEVRQKIAQILVKSRPSEQIEMGVDLSKRILRWEDFRNELLFGRPLGRFWLYFMVFFRMVLAVGGGVAAILAFVQLTTLNSNICRLWEYFLFGFDSLLAIIVISIGIRVYWQYKGIKVQATA